MCEYKTLYKSLVVAMASSNTCLLCHTSLNDDYKYRPLALRSARDKAREYISSLPHITYTSQEQIQL